MDGLNELDAHWGGGDALAFSYDIFALEKLLDNGCAGGWSSDAILLERIAKFLIFHHLSCRLHGAKQGGFCVGLWGSCLLLHQLRHMRALFVQLKIGQSFLLIACTIRSVVCPFRGIADSIICVRFAKHLSPTHYENLLAARLE